jgi:hypothetical protein
MKWVKPHFSSSRADALNPERLEKVRRVFRDANGLGPATVVHTE